MATNTARQPKPSQETAESKDDAGLRGKLFIKLQQANPNTMMYISRSSDFSIVTYSAVRKDRTLHHQVANIRSHDLSEGKDTGPVSQTLVDNFFGFNELTPVPDKQHHFATSIKSMPDRKLTIQVKRKKTHVLTDINGVSDCVLLNVHIHLTMHALAIPTLHKMVLTGIDKRTKQYCQETIPVTPEMTQSFDLTSILAMYSAGKSEQKTPKK